MIHGYIDSDLRFLMYRVCLSVRSIRLITTLTVPGPSQPQGGVHRENSCRYGGLQAVVVESECFG